MTVLKTIDGAEKHLAELDVTFKCCLFLFRKIFDGFYFYFVLLQASKLIVTLSETLKPIPNPESYIFGEVH